MKKLFIIIFDQLETDGRENNEFLFRLVCEQRREQVIYLWQTMNFNLVFLRRQTTLWTIFWLKLLCRYRFWRENMKISSEQSFNTLFRWKNENKSFGHLKYIIFLANYGHL